MSNGINVVMGTDTHARAVYSALIGAGHKARIFDTTDPWEIQGSCVGGLRLRLPGDSIDLDRTNVRSLYWRTHDGPGSDYTGEAWTNRASLFNSWLKEIDRYAHMVNGWDAWQLHQTKPYQNYLTSKLLSGLDHGPLYMPTHRYGYNDTNQCRKGAQGGCFAVGPNEYWPANVAHCSQEAIEGRTIRAYVFANHQAEFIEVQSPYFDYREDDDSKCVIPNPAVQSWLTQALPELVCDRMGWNWAGVDLIEWGKPVRYAILDINPSPMFLGFENHSASILKALVKEISCEWEGRQTEEDEP